jgi:hypothetical protein
LTLDGLGFDRCVVVRTCVPFDAAVAFVVSELGRSRQGCRRRARRPLGTITTATATTTATAATTFALLVGARHRAR